MYCHTHIPERILPDDLDRYLAEGWYRMYHTIFTTHILRRDENWVNAIWLRYALQTWTPGHTFQKLQKRNKHLRIEIGPLELTDSHTTLYKRYRLFKFNDTEADLYSSIYGIDNNNPFQTLLISCYDHNRLVAGGILDMGTTAAAGIVSYYEPEYEKYSLGKFLIYQKILYCQQAGLRYFYPGYVLTGIPEFDYKLGIGGASVEFYQLCSSQWKPWSAFSVQEWHLEEMIQKLEALKPYLEAKGLVPQRIYFEAFDFSLYAPFAGPLWDCPVYLHLGRHEIPEREWIVKFDIRTQAYQYFLTSPTEEDDYILKEDRWYCINLFDFFPMPAPDL